FDLKPVDEGLTVVIKPSQAALDNMDDFVTNMHTESGLITEFADGMDLADAEQQIYDYIVQRIPDVRSAPLAGNSIATDRAFIAKYLPTVDAHLHYRNLDVSSIKILARQWFPRIYFHAPAKNGGHRALADIQESIRELDYYRGAIFVADPGPTSDELKAVAATITEKYAE